MKYFPTGNKNRLIYPPTLSPYKNGIEWLKDQRPFNFKCLLPKADFRMSYFELGSLLNKLAKVCSSFLSEKVF